MWKCEVGECGGQGSFLLSALQMRDKVGAQTKNSALYLLSPPLTRSTFGQYRQGFLSPSYKPSQAWLGAMKGPIHHPPWQVNPCSDEYSHARAARMSLIPIKIVSSWLLAAFLCEVHPKIDDPSPAHYCFSSLWREILWGPSAMTVFGAAILIRFCGLQDL